MTRPVALVEPDPLDEWLQTVRATGVDPSLVAAVVAGLARTQHPRYRAVAAWHWYRRFGAAVTHAKRN